MFGFFTNMLYPANKFLTTVLGLLKYKPTYDIDELTEQMNDKEQCELLNGELEVDELNKKLKLKNFLLNRLAINKSIFVFKRNYMTGEKTILSFEDVTIDIIPNNIVEKNNIIQEGEEKKTDSGFLDTLINTVIQNVEISFKNIKLRFYDKNNNIQFSFFIKSFDFKEAQNIEPLPLSERPKFLFIHNKALYIDGILLKEKYEENDDIFFSDKEEDNENKNKFLLQSNNLFYIKNKIEIDIFHDKVNNNLTLGTNNNSDFYIESIFNIDQLKSLYEYFIPKKENMINENNNNLDSSKSNNNNIEKVNEEKEKGFSLMGFKIEKINLDLKIWLFYFILLENNEKNENKDKLWISRQDNLKYDNLKDNGINSHFNYLQSKYYILSIYDLLLKLSNDEISINDISLKLIEPENKDNKNIINITNFNFNKESNQLLYDNIYIEVCTIILYLLKLFPNSSKRKSSSKIKKEDENTLQAEKVDINTNENNNNNQEIIISTDNKINEEKKSFNLNGKNLDIKIYIDKNIESNINENISLKDIFSNIFQNDFINITINNLNLNENNSINYDKIYISYNDTQNKIYPLMKIVEHRNTSEFQNSKFICNENKFLIDLQFQILLFINPAKIKNILTYFKFISNLLKKPNVNEVHENSSNNNNNHNQLYLIDSINKNIDITIRKIKIVLINEEETYLNIEKTFSNEQIQSEIDFVKNNNYVCINLTDIGAKLECNQEKKKCNIHLKSLIIEDNILNSIYKILFSNYNFKNKEEILLNCDFDIQKNNNKYEIKPLIKFSSIAIYLDEFTLYYLYKIFEQLKDPKENENTPLNTINSNENNNNLTNNTDNSIIFTNILIENFFIQINYETNSEVNDEEFLSKTIIKLLVSLKNLKIFFKEYNNNTDKFNLLDAIKNIYEFYYSDIIKQGGSVVMALPFINHISTIIEGSLDIVSKPIENYKKNESVMGGLVEGVYSWAVNLATPLTYLGEYSFNLLGCGRRDEDNINNNFCRSMRHKFNDKNKEIEEYYFK